MGDFIEMHLRFDTTHPNKIRNKQEIVSSLRIMGSSYVPGFDPGFFWQGSELDLQTTSDLRSHDS